MFHVKPRRRLGLVLLLAVPLLAACGGITGSTGWAPPVPLPDGSTVVLTRDSDDKLTAVDIATATELWRFPDADKRFPGLSEDSDFAAYYGAPVRLDGTDEYLVASEEDGIVYALRADGTSGRVIFDTDDRVIAGIVVADGVAYVGTTDKHLYAVDPDQPEAALWTYDDFGGELWGTPALAETQTHGQVLVVPAMDGHVYAVRTDPSLAPDERLAWRFEDTDSSIAGSVVVDGRTAYFGSFDRHFYALDVEGGEAIWSAPGDIWFWGTALLDGGRVYAADLSGKVWAWDKATGDPVWLAPFEAGDEVRAQPLMLNDGSLLVVAKNGHVFAVDPDDGMERWSIATPIDDDVLADPAVVAGRVIVSNDDGELFEILVAEQQIRPIYPPPSAQG